MTNHRPHPLTPSTLAGLAASLLLLAACSGGGAASTVPPGGGAGSGSTAPVGTGQASSAPGAASSGAVTGHVGDKLTFNGSFDESFDATLVKVFDPATPSSSDTEPLPSGARWVGVETTIDNHSAQAGNELMTVDGVASDGTLLTTLDDYQSFSRPIGQFQGCTGTTSSMESNVPHTQCDAFVVPDGQSLVQVGFNIAQFGTSDQATWTVP
jgi:hypothetical protein